MRVVGKKFTYIQETRCLPNRTVTNLEMIEHPGAALIVPFKSPSEVIFLRQYRPVIRKYLFELPAGTRDHKEAPLSCARRELIEETGFAARRFEKLGKIYLAPGYSTEIIYIYKAVELYPAKAEADLDEIIKTEILTRRRVQDLFQKGLIVDAKTICALALAQWL